MPLIHNFILLLFRVIATLACCALPYAAHALAVELPLAAQDVQIKGLTAQATFSITVDAKKDRKSDPVLRLVWLKSRLIDVKRSTLSVVLNGSIRRTLWLADLGEGVYEVPLTGLAGGVHSLVLRASLRVDDDPCLQQYREDAWFTIKAESSLAWERRNEALQNVVATPVKRYPDAWQRLAGGWSGIHLDMQGATQALVTAQASAYLEAHHLLRRWGYQAQRQTNSRTVGRLQLMTLADLDVNSESNRAIIMRFTQTPAVQFTVIADGQSGLSVVGRDAAGLREGIALLADDTARALCNEAVCEGGAAPLTLGASTLNALSASVLAAVAPVAAPVASSATPAPRPAIAGTTATGKPDASKPDATRVWTLRQTDYAKGWLARGEGTHVLAFSWQRPATWKIAAWPMLRLHGQASTASTVDAANSVVTVRLNGRPLASYPLSQWSSQRSEVRIPTELWEAQQWAFEVIVTLKATQSKSCIGADEDSLWFAVGADTELLVPRQEQAFDSVGRFYSDAVVLGGLPALYAPTLKLDLLDSLAPVLYPFYQAHIQGQTPATKASPRWQWADVQTCQTQRCVQLLTQSRDGALLRIEGEHWQPNGLNLPHIPTPGTVALFYQAASPTQGAQLYAVAGPPAIASDEPLLAAPMEPPDYAGLLGRIALFSKRWLPLDVQPMTADGSLIGKPNLKDNPLDENTPSKEQVSLRWLNFVWAGLSVLVLAGVFFKLWRKPKNKIVDDNWEMHDE